MYYIYRITNKVNGKTYIGQHKYKKLNDSYMGSGIILHKAFEKYGKENFTKEILYSRIQYQETANSMEKFAIAKERALGKAEYNIANGGQGGDFLDVNPNIGKHHSEETKIKISEGNKGKVLSDETKRKISEARKGQASSQKGKKHTKEQNRITSESTKEAMSRPDVRKRLSDGCKDPERCRKISEAKKLWWENKRREKNGK